VAVPADGDQRPPERPVTGPARRRPYVPIAQHLGDLAHGRASVEPPCSPLDLVDAALGLAESVGEDLLRHPAQSDRRQVMVHVRRGPEMDAIGAAFAPALTALNSAVRRRQAAGVRCMIDALVRQA
jgi:hypothetical protein